MPHIALVTAAVARASDEDLAPLQDALLALDAEPGWLAEDGVIVTQIHPREEQPVALEHFEERDRRDYGSVRLIFYRPRPDSVAPDGDAAVREADGVPDGQAAPRPQAPRR